MSMVFQMKVDSKKQLSQEINKGIIELAKKEFSVKLNKGLVDDDDEEDREFTNFMSQYDTHRDNLNDSQSLNPMYQSMHIPSSQDLMN